MKEAKKDIFIWSSKHKFPVWSAIIFIVSLGLLIIFQNSYYHATYKSRDLNKFQKTLIEKERFVLDEFDRIIAAADGNLKEELDKESVYLGKLSVEQGISFYYYEDGRLLYWSDHTVPIHPRRSNRPHPPLVNLRNATYLAVEKPVENGTLVSFILLKTHYQFENEYLVNSFQKDFDFKAEIELQRGNEDDFGAIWNNGGAYLFTLGVEDVLKSNRLLITFSLLLILFALSALFVFMSLKTDQQTTKGLRALWMFISGVSVLSFTVMLIYLKFPRIIYESKLFQPGLFAGRVFSSLGHLWVFILLVLMLTFFLFWFFDRSKEIPKKYYTLVAIIFQVLAAFWFVFVYQLGKILVLDSTISFQFYKLDSLSGYTILAMATLAMAFLIFVLLSIIVLRFVPNKNRKLQGALLLIGLLVLGVFLLVENCSLEWTNFLFYLLFCASIYHLMRYKSERPKFSRYFVLLILFSLYGTIDLLEHSSEKLENQKGIELAKLSSEHDAVAEMLFVDLSKGLRKDSLLMQRLAYEIIEIDLVYDYLQRNYFSGYWTKYDLQITLCRPEDSVYVEPPADDWFHCYSFFDELVSDEGLKLDDSDFYFLSNLNGRISYMGVIPFMEDEQKINLFMELDSKISSEELGYPELLLKEESTHSSQFSYAKYNKGKMITSGGDYSYRLTSDYYTSRENTFEKIKEDGYDHTVFNVDLENTVVVSYKSLTIVDKLISFSYMFAFSFLLFALSYLAVLSPHLRRTVTWDFKNKIQYSVIGILFFTFVFICSGTIFFLIQQYRMKHQDNLENTMRSLYIELVHKVEFEEDLRNWSSDKYYNLDELLRKFSNVFYTDINMYNQRGVLLATSRSEIFDQHLLSKRMNREAYEKLTMEAYSAFVQTEKIGKMSYQSAYVPLLNSENRLLAYMNLPYFTQPEILTQEVTNLVVAILNTYVILLLFILLLTVFLADRITQPLRFIQSRIAQLSLSEKNEKIIYSGKDEVAGLVKEYNYMVEELQKSAELLAQSERESAWREMAKQIAHEIKNPLTPMKLNVQHLQRMISEGSENIEEQVEKVSVMLIEQIDSLTSIANEFSDFAKMPKAKRRDIDIELKLNNVVHLFENTEGVHINFEIGEFVDVQTFGDPEQFLRVIINLVKNGIQSVPDGREKKISISLEEAPDDMIIIAIADNGAGISPEIEDKLFHPNFTTKSSGMGMGLAISSNIIKTMDGNIWYSTKPGEGTIFFVKVPVTNR